MGAERDGEYGRHDSVEDNTWSGHIIYTLYYFLCRNSVNMLKMGVS